MAEEIREKTEERPAWAIMMEEISGMMEVALEEAHEILLRFFGSTETPEIPAASIIRMAASIFEATANAEGARRMIEAQQGGRLSKATGIIQIDPVTGRPV